MYHGIDLERFARSTGPQGRNQAQPPVIVELGPAAPAGAWDLATAQACYRSAEYQAALALRKSASTADVIIIDGYDGPQPGQ